MTTLIMDRHVEAAVRKQRIASGADRFDEVWEGVYVMNPMPNVEHQQIVTRLASILQEALDWSDRGIVLAGVNVSDRESGWQENYRVPDIAVFLRDGAAQNCGTHWRGGPDFAVEVVSEDDQTYDKLPFYAAVGVRELLIVERNPWKLVLLRLSDGKLIRASETEQEQKLVSEAIPFAFRLIGSKDRPHIEVCRTDGERSWLV